MKRILVALGITAILFFTWYYKTHPLVSKIRIRDVVITTEIAATELQKQKGLGDRDSMDPLHGMLFPYDHKEQYNFWMRGMKFPLDFIWIDGMTVVDITTNVAPPLSDETPMMVKPKVAVDKVLEVNAGFVEKHGIAVGDPVRFLDR